jgi:2'-5' RNA ligase
VRLFLAINLPSEVRRLAYEAAAPLRAAASTVHWVAEQNLHVTLKFLGEMPEGTDADVVRVLGAVADRHTEIPIAIGGTGGFPNLRRPRVVWLGITAEPKLELLHHDVEVACESLGFAVEGRAFRPHVTLGRVRSVLPPDEGRALASAARTMRFRAACTVETIDVMRSDLAPGGSRYTRLAALPLLPTRSD